MGALVGRGSERGGQKAGDIGAELGHIWTLGRNMAEGVEGREGTRRSIEEGAETGGE